MGEERRYSAEFKKAAVERMATHGSVQGLADELGIRRKFLYLWRSQFEQFGEAALARGRGRPKGSRSSTAAKPASPVGSSEKARIEELERLLGRKQLEVDFFRQAFEHVRGGRAKNSTSGAKGSTAPSELNSRSKGN
jgi:transposase